ncbi:MAG: hypothetical protein Q8P01_02280 [bacterium]|nr:hypothetical protein [bacterium]
MPYSADAFPQGAKVSVPTLAINPSWKPTPSFNGIWSYGTVSAIREGVLLVLLEGESKPIEIPLDGTVTVLDITPPWQETLPRQNGKK